MLEYQAIADRIAADRIGPVLDWGCGWGQVSSLLRARGVDVEAFDYRAGEPLHETELEHFSGFRVQVSGEPVSLPYSDDHFGAVLSCGVLEHVQDPDGSLDELHRILRPSGRLYIYKLPNRLSYLEAIAKRAGLYYHGKLENDRLYDVASTRQILHDHRFRVDEAQLANMLPLTISHPLASRHAESIWKANKALTRVPGLDRLATNVEAVATAV
jgi:ubiquinone/menaquinone biosynthesis C-methylase UbiE